jgi:hypothetical protein
MTRPLSLNVSLKIVHERNSAKLFPPFHESIWSAGDELRMGYAMPASTSQLIQDMRKALEDVMAKVPAEYATAAVKVYLAECILKAAAQGHTNYNELVVAAADQIQTAISLFT